MSSLLNVQIDAARVSTRQDQAVTAQRHTGVRIAIRHLVNGSRDLALDELLRSVEKQARFRGCGRIHLVREVA